MAAPPPLDPRIRQELTALTTKLRRRQVSGFHSTAQSTAELLRSVVTTTRWQVPAQIIDRILAVGRELVAAAPGELCVGNVVRRVLHIVREEVDAVTRGPRAVPGARAPTPEGSEGPGAEEGDPGMPQMAGGASTAPSLHNLLAGDDGGPGGARLLAADAGGEVPGASLHEIKQSIIDGINELIVELKELVNAIADQAPEHIHAREVVLTLGRSRIMEAFLRQVARTKRPFEVFVADTAPAYDGADVARRLADAQIQATLIPDACVFALMARINKVIIAPHAVMANGGVVAPAGCHAVALAAHHHSVPFVVCAGIPQLSPIFPSDPDDLIGLLGPGPVLPYAEAGGPEFGAAAAEGPEGGVPTTAEAPNPAYDYIPPELVSLFITNIGGTHASYIYRLLSEYYSTQDYQLAGLDPTQR